VPVHCFRDTAKGRVGEIVLKALRRAVPSLVPGLDGCKIIHAHFGVNGLVAWPLARKIGVPLVTTFHGLDATYRGNPLSMAGIYNKIYFSFGRDLMARNLFTCIAVSDYIRERLMGFGFSPDHIVKHYIGLDVSFFQPSTVVQRVRNRVICIARFIEYKGHRYIIEALGRLVDAGREIELVLVGQGPLRDEIEQSARTRLSNVTMLENQSREQILELVQSAQLYIHGSYTMANGHAEALGIAILEAQAVGTPVVVFDSGGVVEGMDRDRSGYAVPERDVRAMSEAVAKLLDDANRWQSFSDAAVSFIRRKFDIVQQTSELERIYDVVRDKARR
jgi:colanic acid/amylovoran biosynthesis glycosyltransferase